MKYGDVSAMIVMYNLVIGILVMLASGGISNMAAKIGPTISRYAWVTVFTLGACITTVSGSVYLFVHVLRLGVD